MVYEKMYVDGDDESASNATAGDKDYQESYLADAITSVVMLMTIRNLD